MEPPPLPEERIRAAESPLSGNSLVCGCNGAPEHWGSSEQLHPQLVGHQVASGGPGERGLKRR